MRVRAERAGRTRQAVLDAAARQLKARLRSDIRLEDVASEAGVTVQTVLRLYGSKGQLFQAALDQVIREMRQNFEQAQPGDVAAAVRTWFDHYEQFGDVVIASLADEYDPAVAPVVRIGRGRHRERVQTVLAPQLGRFPEAQRTRLVDALVCVCDVYTWKLLRRDMRRPRARAEATMKLMIDSLLGEE